jgi:hypothetical protein
VCGIDCLLLAELQSISNTENKAGRLKRLFDEIERTRLDGGDRHLDVAVRRDQDNWRSDTARIETTHEFEAGKAGHPNVGHYAVEPPAAIKRGEKRFGRGKAQALEALSVQVEMQGVEHTRIVVHQSDANWLTHGPTT